MKKIVFAACGFMAVALSACTEIHNRSTVKPVTASDTTYMATPETAMPRNVLVHEYTGVRCTNCPGGASILKALEEANPGRIVVMGVHSGALTSPIEGESQYNFVTQDATDLMTFFNDEPPKPQAAIDQVKQSSGKYFVTTGFWQGQINGRLTIPSKENITITSDYNDATRQAIITVRIAYTATETKKQKLMVGILEDGIIDAQMYPDSTSLHYTHNHVLRDLLTIYSGTSILDNVDKVPGRVYERTFIYDVNADWNAENCRIVAYVFNNELNNNNEYDYEVGQATEAHLVQ